MTQILILDNTDDHHIVAEFHSNSGDKQRVTMTPYGLMLSIIGMTATTPNNQVIVSYRDGITLERKEDDSARVLGLKARITHHSPTGFEWGYQGSGPADLALNILEEYLWRISHDGPSIEVWRGRCFQLAWLLHQDFKQDVIARIPHEGGLISWKDVKDWMQQHSQSVKFYQED